MYPITALWPKYVWILLKGGLKYFSTFEVTAE